MEEFIRYNEFKEDDESILEVYFSSNCPNGFDHISNFSIKQFGNCGEKELLKQKCINRMTEMKNQIDEMIAKVKEN